MRRLLFFILILSTTQVLATRVVGNGGDAIVCRKNGKIFSAELLDFFEARVLRNIQLFTPTPNQDYKTIISDRLAIMEKVSPNNAKLIREELDVITGDGHL